MCTITATEFKRNFGKYLKVAQEEKINVTFRGKVVFVTSPSKEKRLIDMESILNVLPANASFDDIDRE
ncbi:MAG: type II toxin-antitoxin system prevent-host-death family antitoxin [Bacilli bacterium]|nr:type II toxin-antitoxin system prevent-host-death family antitoxin [Bacilli bacterium]